MAAEFGGYDREGLEYITDEFSTENYIGEFQFGRIYRAKDCLGQHLLVKVWDKDEVDDDCQVWLEDKQGRMRDECCLAYDDRLQAHPNMIKISGISWADFTPTMVYELNAMDTVYNLVDRDNFSWLHRVKVALGIASLLKCMHECRPLPYLIRNISAAHIILDQDCNAKIFDFSMISGGILADKTGLLNQRLQGCYGYIDPDYVRRGRWSEKCDVFAFGVVLISLIAKRVQTEMNRMTSPEPLLHEWAHNEYKKKSCRSKLIPSKFSLVHKSLKTQPFFSKGDGIAFTELAMQCVNYNPKKRPTMKQVFNSLWELFVVQYNADILSLENMKAVQRLSTSGKSLKTLFKSLSLSGEDTQIRACRAWKYVAPSRLSYEEIRSYTDGFSKENFINIYPFGKLYHGSIDSRKVTVKTWEDVDTHYVQPEDNEIRLRDELTLLQHPKFVSHPHIVKMIGYCYENEKLSAVYDLQSLDSLFNLVSESTFTWHKRIILILELARVLKYLQVKNPPYMPYVLRNISPHTILVDEHYKPKLFDFGMLLGGIMNDQKHYRIPHVHSWDYYTDPYTNCYYHYTEVSDIYSLGMVILNLITQICYTDFEVEFDEWVRHEFERAKSKGGRLYKRFSLVNGMFCEDVGFLRSDGRQLTKLALQCIHTDYSKRPTINQVIKRLKNLRIMSRFSSS